MKMLGDCELFVQLCENCNIQAPPEVLEKIKIGSTTGELQLSSMSIVVPICGILARVLASSLTIRKVDLGDCMLLSKGLASILNALSEGSNVTSLNLKGNNINGPAIGQLGKIFLRNNTLKRLSLEWNALGSDIDEFAKFCESICANNNIEELDMRYNQITPDCADSIAKVLRNNKSLKSIDLAWNTLGLRGGRTLLDAVRDNRVTTRLNLRGNCIPDEIIRSIDESIGKNQSESLVYRANFNESCNKIALIRDDDATKNEENLVRDDLTTSESMKIRSKLTKTREFRRDIVELENFCKTTKLVETELGDVEFSEKICKFTEPDDKFLELNKMLQERSVAIELLTKEIGTRARDAEKAESHVKQLENEIKQLREERESLSMEKSREIAELREIREKSDDHWQREYRRLEASLSDALSREKELESRVQRYERDIRKNSAEMTSLREKSVAQTRHCEDLLAKSRLELHRARREIRERENRRKIEINVLRSSLKESTEGLEDCQAQLQKSRAELRESGESFASLRTRLAELERQNCRLARIEESHGRLRDEKKLSDEKIQDFQSTASTLQRQIAKLQAELVEPRRRYELVSDELEQERQKTGRLRLELAEERARQQEQNSQIQALNAQINALNNQINEMQNNHAEAIRERDRERKILKDVISNKERDFNEFKTEEVQRASQLYAAFSKYYLGAIGPNATS